MSGFFSSQFFKDLGNDSPIGECSFLPPRVQTSFPTEVFLLISSEPCGKVRAAHFPSLAVLSLQSTLWLSPTAQALGRAHPLSFSASFDSMRRSPGFLWRLSSFFARIRLLAKSLRFSKVKRFLLTPLPRSIDLLSELLLAVSPSLKALPRFQTDDPLLNPEGTVPSTEAFLGSVAVVIFATFRQAAFPPDLSPPLQP